MEDISVYLIATVMTLITWIIIQEYREWARYPPGPFPVPMFGNLPGVIWNGGLSEYLSVCQKKYGNVFTVTLGGAKQVMVLEEENIRRVNYDLADYTSNRARLTEGQPGSGIIYGQYPHWKIHRSFAISSLRSEGMGRSMLQPQIHEEVDCFCSEFIQPYLGQPIDIATSLSYATANVMSQLIYGSRTDYKNESVKEIVDDLGRAVRAAKLGFLLNGIPFVGSLLAKHLGLKPDSIKILRKIISEAKISAENDDNEEPAGYLQRCLKYSKQLKNDGHPPEYYNDDQLVSSCRQLYAAGTETTSTALSWAFLFAIAHPRVQEMIYHEIKGVIGSRQVTQADKKSMPLTDSFLTEVLRLKSSSGLSFGLSRFLDIDAEIGGKLVPAGARLTLLYGSISRQNFENVDEFMPHRFMNSGAADRKMFQPFGTGRRNCVGEPLAQMELFIFFVTLLQRYKLSAVPGAALNLTSNNASLTIGPFPYKVVITPH